MQIFTSIADFQLWRENISGTIGFVPTMGALHKGHLSLVEYSNKKCDTTVVSIYVNPTQFNPSEDLSSYPRDVDADIKLMKYYNVSAVFVPTDVMIYPNDFSTVIFEQQLSSKLEGISRPAHFKGVTTVVAKLFNIVQPTHAFFGEKDAQQLRVIQKMVLDLNFPVEIVPCPIIREENGLAMSSRNEYLSDDTRKRASIIFHSLEMVKKQLQAGETSSKQVVGFIKKTITSEPLAKIDYISVANSKTLVEIDGNLSGEILVSVAVFFNKTRLVDNFTIIL